MPGNKYKTKKKYTCSQCEKSWNYEDVIVPDVEVARCPKCNLEWRPVVFSHHWKEHAFRREQLKHDLKSNRAKIKQLQREMELIQSELDEPVVDN